MVPVREVIEKRQAGSPALGYAQLSRPANMVTAAADVLAGYAAASSATPSGLAWLVVSTMALYGGGVTFNDFFDRKLDAVERPERPIPSGRVPAAGAALMGTAMLAAGIAAAFGTSPASGTVATGIALAALLYDAAAKHHRLAGPALMGVCRGLNLLLGISGAPAAMSECWFLPLLPVCYVAAITVMSAGEVHGGSRRTGLISLSLFAGSGAGLLALGVLRNFSLTPMVPFLLLLGWRVGPPVWRACMVSEPSAIRGAVRAGVLSLIVLDAAVAAGFGGFLYGAAVLCLMIPAFGLARLFPVT